MRATGGPGTDGRQADFTAGGQTLSGQRTGARMRLAMISGVMASPRGGSGPLREAEDRVGTEGAGQEGTAPGAGRQAASAALAL